MSEPSTTAGTWTPDADDIAGAIFNTLSNEFGWIGNALEALADRAAEISCREIDKQAAAAGLVMVRREDLEVILSRPIIRTKALDLALRRLPIALVATPKPTPGGDG